MFGLGGKVAVITGSGRGIGAAIAKTLAKAGAEVVVTSRHIGECESVAEGIRKAGGEAAFVKCDVSIEEDVSGLVDWTVKKYGSLDIMVNNAGIYETESVLETGEEMWRLVLSVDLDGVFFGTKCAAKEMRKKKWGRIINVSSVSGLAGFSKRAAYCAAKSGVIGLTRSSAAELGALGITVNAICPGLIKTRMTEHFIGNWLTLNAFLRRIPIRRAGLPEDVARAALFFASEEAGYITGQALAIDGGWSCGV